MGGNTKRVTLQGNSTSFIFYSLSLSRAFLAEDRLSFTLSAGNFIGRYRHFRNETITPVFRSLSDSRIDLMRLSIGVSYRLGSLKTSVKKTARSIENDDIIKGNNSSSSTGGEGGTQQM